MPAPRSAAKALVTSTFRLSPARAVAWRLASARHRALVLVYHRVHPDGPRPDDVVPTVTPDQLAEHVGALTRVGRLIGAEALVGGVDRGSRPAFTITFDDDYVEHVEFALPVLTGMGVSATFFLAGRASHGLGPYWWQRLEALIRRRGLAAARDELGLQGTSPGDLAASVEASPALIERLNAHEAGGTELLGTGGVEALVAAGMTIGFHTVRHPVFPGMAADRVRDDLVAGRAELEQVVGNTVSLFAYPHGKADGATARLAEAAGYRAAFTGGGRPVGRRTDRFLLSRWEPGPVGAEELLAGAAARFSRPAGRRR